MYKKIDFRVRPPYGNYLTMFQNEQAHFARLADAFDMTVSESQRTGNLEQFVKEMDLADIEISVVPGRKNLGNVSAYSEISRPFYDLSLHRSDRRG